jgi:hypothetical protein
MSALELVGSVDADADIGADGSSRFYDGTGGGETGIGRGSRAAG